MVYRLIEWQITLFFTFKMSLVRFEIWGSILDIFLENEAFFQFFWRRLHINKSWFPSLIFFKEKKIRTIQMIFWHWKIDFENQNFAIFKAIFLPLWFEPCRCQNSLFIIIQRISNCGILTIQQIVRARLPTFVDIC